MWARVYDTQRVAFPLRHFDLDFVELRRQNSSSTGYEASPRDYLHIKGLNASQKWW